MSKTFLSICLLICLSSTCYGLQIAPPWDDWTFPDPGPGIIIQIIPPDDIAAVLVPDGWQFLAGHDFDSAERGETRNGTQLKMDISVVASEWTMSAGWVKPIDMIVVQSSFNSWQEIAPVEEWIWDGQADETRTMVFNIPAQGDVSYLNLTLNTNRGITEEAGFIYLHNAYLVPEPITAALLGLGGLALVRRKK